MFAIAPTTKQLCLPRFILCGHTQTQAERLGWGHDDQNEQRSVVWLEAVKDALVKFGVCNMAEIVVECRSDRWNGGPLQHDGVLAIRYGIWECLNGDGIWEFRNGGAREHGFACSEGEVVDQPVSNVVSLVQAAALEAGANAIEVYDRMLDRDKTEASPSTYGTAPEAEKEVDELREIMRRVNKRVVLDPWPSFEQRKWAVAANAIEKAMSALWSLVEVEK